MTDQPMHIRQKGNKIRITFADTSKPQNVDYITIDPQICWSATYNAWGKKVESRVVKIGVKTFAVHLEEIW